MLAWRGGEGERVTGDEGGRREEDSWKRTNNDKKKRLADYH